VSVTTLRTRECSRALAVAPQTDPKGRTGSAFRTGHNRSTRVGRARIRRLGSVPENRCHCSWPQPSGAFRRETPRFYKATCLTPAHAQGCSERTEHRRTALFSSRPVLGMRAGSSVQRKSTEAQLNTFLRREKRKVPNGTLHRRETLQRRRTAWSQLRCRRA
jgi:hypothetical protein